MQERLCVRTEVCKPSLRYLQAATLIPRHSGCSHSEDPNTSQLKLRQLTELLAQLVATKVGLYQSPEES
jgi:hypothetical protein